MRGANRDAAAATLRHAAECAAASASGLGLRGWSWREGTVSGLTSATITLPGLRILAPSTVGQELPALRGHKSGPSWQPGAGGMCLHTIILDPATPGRMFAAISAAGAFRSDDAGQTWRPVNHGLHSQGIPDADAEVGHCVHRLAMHPSRPSVLYMQKHWDVMRSDDAGGFR